MSKRPKRRYDDKFRAAAVVMLDAQGYPDKKGALLEVSRHLDVPRSTLHGWHRASRNPPPSDLRTEKKGDLAALLRQEAEAILNTMPDERPNADFRSLTVALGIVIDKLQLLEGKPTERHEHDVISPRESILGQLTRYAARDRAAQDPEPVQ